jgi:aryl-alcohol dehydrogenase-like predicted oxidoreductase
MEYRRFGRTGMKVTELCLGTMTFGREADEETSQAILRRYLEAGGNFVDTANGYGARPGLSEEIVGRGLVGRRHEVVVATKVRFPAGPGVNDRGLSRRHIRQQVEGSLKRLQTDWIDLYQVHSWDPETPLEETLSTLDDLVRTGMVRYIGVSNFAAWQLAQALGLSALHGWEAFVSLQPTYSLVTRDIERELLPLCRSVGLAVMPFGPLAGGMLTGKYRAGEPAQPGTRAAGGSTSAGMARRLTERGFAIADAVRAGADQLGKTPAQVALNWVATREGITCPILGARTIDQLDDNLGAIGWRLDPEVERGLDAASAIDIGYPQNLHARHAETGL